MSLEPRTRERIAREFTSSDATSVIELLSSYSGPEAGRVAWDILELSKGKVEKVRQYLQAAQKDYRDILYWAEYYDSDPMFDPRLGGGDPKQMVDDIIGKWGTKE
jgi:hypothetical protein